MVHLPRHISRRAVATSVATAVLLALGLALTVSWESARIHKPLRASHGAGFSGRHGGHGDSGDQGWARTVTGAIVQVRAADVATPTTHPELLTHPAADAMGSFEQTRTLQDSTPPPAAGSSGGAPSSSPVGQPSTVSQLPGIDLSNHQGALDWAQLTSHVDFVYIEATEATSFENPDFTDQYNSSHEAGLIRGAYHFAVPSNSTGTAQADYFLAHGGGWSAHQRTLPGTLDIEYNPYGAECYGLTTQQMVAWINDFVTEYALKTHAYPVIYSTAGWWNQCTGGSGAFANLDPLWTASYRASAAGTLPRGWSTYTFWQYADSGQLPGDQDRFNGALSRLDVLSSRG
jgi:GH25 family lysozyme M1 (1,4-beta-N-acetylmuramidase)